MEPRSAAPTFDELYEQIRALPEGKTGLILEPGELTVMSRPHARHQRASKGLLRALSSKDEDAGGTGWWILDEVEIRFPDDRLLVPDVVGFRTDRVPELPDENPLRVVPDWACEILSPNTVRDDRVKKLRIYAQHDVPWVWLVDPSARTIECFETIDRLPRQTVVAADAEVTSLPPFDDLPFDLARIWGAAPVSGS